MGDWYSVLVNLIGSALKHGLFDVMFVRGSGEGDRFDS